MSDKENVKVLMTERPDGPENESVLKTPSGEANVSVVTMNWWTQVLIRVARTYLQSLLGFILALGSGAADAVGLHLPAGDFGVLLLYSASLAVAPAVISLLQNAIELLAKLDVTVPQMRA